MIPITKTPHETTRVDWIYGEMGGIMLMFRPKTSILSVQSSNQRGMGWRSNVLM